MPSQTNKITRSKDTRKVIIETAGELFSQRGYRETSIGDIAKKVGIKSPTLYHHFESKADILYEYIESRLIDFRENIDHASIINGGTVSERLASMVSMSAQLQLKKYQGVPFVNTLIYNNIRKSDVFPKERIEQIEFLQKQIYLKFRNLLMEGRETGEFNFDDATITAFSIIGMIDHAVYWYRTDGRQSVDEVARKFAGLALKMVRKET